MTQPKESPDPTFIKQLTRTKSQQHEIVRHSELDLAPHLSAFTSVICQLTVRHLTKVITAEPCPGYRWHAAAASELHYGLYEALTGTVRISSSSRRSG